MSAGHTRTICYFAGDLKGIYNNMISLYRMFDSKLYTLWMQSNPTGLREQEFMNQLDSILYLDDIREGRNNG